MPGNDTAFGNHVEHGDLFGDPLRMIVEGKTLPRTTSFACLVRRARQAAMMLGDGMPP